MALSWLGKKNNETPTSIIKQVDFASLPNLLTIEQVSEILGVHPNTLRNWDRSGKLRAIRIGTRQDRRYDKLSIEKLYNEFKPSANSGIVPLSTVGNSQPLPEPEEKSYVLEPGFSWHWFQLYLMSRKFSLYIFSVLLVAFSFAVVQVSFFAYIYLARAAESPLEEVLIQPGRATGWETTAQVLAIDLLPAASLSEFVDANAAHYHTAPTSDSTDPVTIEQHIELEDSRVAIEEQSPVPLNSAQPELVVSAFTLPDSVADTDVLTKSAVRFSLAVDGVADSEDVLSLEYSLDQGANWQALQSFVLSEDMSNAINGGYFEYPIGSLTTIADIAKVQVRARLNTGTAAIEAVAWIDGINLVVETQRPDPVLTDIENSVTFVTDSDMDLALTEQPVISVETEETSAFDFIGVEPIVRDIGTVTITSPNGETHTAPVTIAETTDHDITTSEVAIDPSALTEPGKYSVTMTVEQDGRTQQIIYNFTWGALALNTDQANYQLGETAAFSLGAVDDTGHIVCTADMRLSIIDPAGTETVLTSADGTIQVTDYCYVKDVYQGPDYTATYIPALPGTYQVTLVASVNGEARTVSDAFSVAPEAPFEIKRDGPTRVFPNVRQPMRLTITSPDGYTGMVREILPSIFDAFPGSGGAVENYDTGKEIARSIIWQVDIAPGGTATLQYEFKSPEKSPATFALGPAQIGDWAEPRAWQLVIDPAYMYLLGNSASAPTGWTNDTTTFAGYYPRGAATTDTTPPTGGAVSHTHTVSGQTHSSASATQDYLLGGANVATAAHTHTIGSLTVGSANNDPLNHTFYLWKSNTTDPGTIPANAYTFFDTAPSGNWTRFSAADNRMVKINASNTTGGTADTHTHSLTWGTLTASTGTVSVIDDFSTAARPTHTHTAPAGTTSTSYTLLPSYIRSLIYQATANNLVPQNLIAMWDSAPPTGWTTVSGASQTYNGQFIRGDSAYSATPQSADTHSVADQTSGASGNSSIGFISEGLAGSTVATHPHTHTITAGFNANTDHKPQYFDVIMAECTNASGCGPAISISGSAYSDEGSTKITSAAKTVVAWVNGSATACGGGACTAETSAGDFTINNVTAGLGSVITLFLDNETEKATTFLVADGANITGAPLYQNRVILRQDTGTSITNANIESGDRDASGETDILAEVATSNLTVDTNYELHIWTGDTYDPNGTVTTQGTGNLHVDDSATAYLDTATSTIGNDVNIDTSATLNVSADATVNGGANSGVNTAGALNHTAGTFTIGNGGADEDLNVTAGTVTISGGNTIIRDDINHITGGTININAGANVDLTSASGIINMQSGSGQVLNFNGGSTDVGLHMFLDAGTINLNGGTHRAGIAADGIVEFARYANGGMTLNMTGGDLHGRAIIIYSGETLTTTTVTGGTLHVDDLFGPVASAFFYQWSVDSPRFFNLQIDDPAGFDSSASQQLTYLNGSFIIGSGNTFTTNSKPMTIEGNWTNGGTLTPGTGTVTLAGNGNIDGASDTTFYNLTIGDGTAGGVTINGSGDDPTITTGGTLNVDTGDQLTIGSGRTLTHNSATAITFNGAILGPGIMIFTTASAGPGTGGTLSAVARFDASAGNIANTTFDARTYNGTVEAYSSNAGLSRTVTAPASGTFTLNASLNTTCSACGGLILDLDDATDATYVQAGASPEGVTIGASTTVQAPSGTTFIIEGNFANNGTFTANAGTVQLTGASSINGSVDTTFSSLTIGDGSAGTVTVNGTDDPTVSGTFNVDTGDVLSISVSRIVNYSGSADMTFNGTVSGAGRLAFTTGSGGPGTGGTLSVIARYDATNGDVAATTIDIRSYTFPVEFYSNSGVLRNATLAAGTYAFTGASAHVYVVADGTANMNVAANTNNPTVNIGGDLDFTGVGAGTEVITSGTGTWTISNNVDLSGGTYTATSGNTFAMDGGNSNTFNPGGQTFFNFSIADAGSDIQMAGANMTVTNTFSMVNTTQLDIPITYSLTLTSTATFTDTAATILSGAGTLISQVAVFPGLPIISTHVRLDATSNNITVNGRTGTRTLTGAGETVEFYSNTASTRTITVGDVAGRTFSVTGGVTTTRAGAGALTVQVNTYDPTFTIAEALTIGTGTVWEASNSGTFTLNGSYTNNGTFTDNSGTVTLSGTATQTLSGSMTTASNDFYNLTLTNTSGAEGGCAGSFTAGIDFAASATVANNYTIITAGVKVEYNSGSTYAFTNINWTSGGGSRIVFRNSNLSSGTWLLNVTGVQTAVSYVDVGRSDASGGNQIVATDGTNINCGSNTNWDFGYTISGTADGNNGATVRVAYNGTIQGTTGSVSSGTWAISGVAAPATNDEIYVWVDGVADATESSAITIYDGAGHISGMVLNTHVVTIGSGDNPTFTTNNCTSTSYQNLNDEDIMFSCLTTLDGSDFNVDDDNVYADDRLTILSGAHFNMTGAYRLATHDFELNGQFTPGDNVYVSGSWDNNYDYNAAAETVVFTSTTTETIDNTGAIDSDIANMSFSGAGGQWTLNTMQTVNTNLTVSNGTLVVSNALSVTGSIVANGGTIQGTANITVAGNFTGDGTVNMTAGTVEVQNTSNFGGNTSWTFYNLTSGFTGACSASYIMTALGTGAITITNQMTSESCSCGLECGNTTQYALGSKTWHFTGSGVGASAPFTGSVNSYDTSTMSFEGTGSTDVYGGSLYNLRLDPASGTPSYTLDAGTIFGDFYIKPAVNFTHNPGTTLQLAGDGKTIDAGGKIFNRVYINGTNNTVTAINTDFTSTGFLYVKLGSTLTINSGRMVTTSTPSWVTDGTINGAGTLTFTNSAVLDASGTINANVRFDGTAGDVLATLFIARPYGGNVELYNNNSGTSLFSAGAGTLTIGGSLSLNSPSGTCLVDLTTPTVTVTGNFDVPAGDGLQLDTNSMSIGGDVAIYGPFAAGTSLITLNGSAAQAISGSLTGANSFYDLTVTNASPGGVTFNNSMDVDRNFIATTAGTILAFKGGLTYTILNFTVNGQAVGTRIQLIQFGGTGQWNLVVTGTQSVQYVTPSDSNACGGDRIRVYDGTSTNGGNTNCWVFTGVTVSGTLYADQGSSTYNCSSNNITIWGATNGEVGDSAVCTSAVGAFSVTVLPAAVAGDPIILYIDSGEAIQANFVTLAADTSSAISATRLYAGWVVMRHENAGPMTNAKMLIADNGDVGIQYFDNTGVQFNSGINLHLWADDSYDPGGRVLSTGGADIYLDDGSEMWFDTASSTISGDITVSNQLSNPAALHIDASTGMGGSLVVSGSIDGAGSLSINGSFTGGGTVSFTGGTVTFPYTSTVGGLSDWTFNNLAFTHGACGTKVSSFTGLGAFTINGTFTGASCFDGDNWEHYVDLNNKTVILTGNGTPLAAFFADTENNNSIIRYTGTGVTVQGTSYSTLQLSPGSATTYTLQALMGTFVYTSMVINANVTLDASTNTVYGRGLATSFDLNGETLYNFQVFTTGAGVTTVANTDFAVSNILDIDIGDTLSLNSGRTVTLNSTGSLTLDGTISGAGRLAYRPSAAFPTTGTISSILRFDTTNNNLIMSDRVYGGDVELFMPLGSGGAQVTIGTAGSQTPDISGNLIMINNDFDFGLTVDAATYDPSVTVVGNITNGGVVGFTTISAGTGTWTGGGSITLTNGQFIPETGGTLLMNGTGTLFVDNLLGSDTAPYNFQTSGSGTITLDDIMTVSNDVVVGSGTTVTGAQNLTVNGGDITGDGTLNLTAGTLTIPSVNGNLGGNTGWTFNDIHFSSTAFCADRTTTATGSGGVTVNGTLTTDAMMDNGCACTESSCWGHAINAGAKTWILTKSGTAGARPLINNGRFVGGTSIVRYTGTTATEVTATAQYYTLALQPSGGANPTYTFSGVSAVVSQDFIIGDGTNSVTLNGASNNFGASISNDIYCTAGASTNTVTTGTGTWIVTGNTDVSNCDTFTATAGHNLMMNGTGKTVMSGGKSFSNYRVTTGSVASADAMDVNGTFWVSSGAFTQHASSNLNVAGNFTLASGTTFTKSTSGILRLDGDLTYTDSTSPKQNVGNLHIGASLDTTNLASDMAADSLTINDGDFLYTNGYDLDIGTGGITIMDDAGFGGGTFDVNDDVETDGTYMTTDGIFDLPVGGIFANSAGTNVGSTLEFTLSAGASANATSNIITQGVGGLYDVVINDGNGAYFLTVELQDSLVVADDLTITSGVLDTKSGINNSITIGGNWTNADRFEPRLGTVTLNASSVASGTVNIDSTGAAAAAFNDLTLNDSAGNDTFMVESTLDVNDDLLITGGTLDTKTGENNTITVGGDWTNNDIFTARSGVVTADGSAQQTFGGTMTGVSAFYDLTITNNSGSDPETTPSVIFSTAGETDRNFTASTANTKLRFNAGSAYTFQNISFNGQATGTRVFLRSSSTGTQWDINVAGTRSVSNTNVRDSNACGQAPDIDASGGTNIDATNNDCWNIYTISFSISDTTIGFGSLSATQDRYATGDGLGSNTEVQAHTISAATSGGGGYSISVTGNTLTSAASDTITYIGGANTASSTGNEQFGVRANASGGSGSVSAPYADTGFAYDLLNFPDELASSGVASATTTYSLRYLGNISPTTEAGTYGADITYIMTPEF